MLMLTLLVLLQAVPAHPGEDPVAPYAMSDANAGGRPFKSIAMLEAFHGRSGIATLEGRKEVLGLWLENHEGAKFWLRVLTGNGSTDNG